MSKILTKIKEFFQKYEPKIIAVLGFFLISILAFEAGVLKGQKMPESPLIIEKPVSAMIPEKKTNDNSHSEEAKKTLVEDKNAQEPEKKNCAYVGSKKSNKYHLPTCRWAKSIKAENLVCFSSADEAKSKGYLPDGNCIK